MAESVNSIRLKNFKVFRSVEVETDRLNIITGRNNTGKSTLLQAVDIAKNPRNVESFSTRGIRNLINFNSDKSEIELNNRKAITIRKPTDYEEIRYEVGQSLVDDFNRRLDRLDIDHEEEVSHEDIADIVSRTNGLSSKILQRATIVEDDEEQVFLDQISPKLRIEIYQAILENICPEKSEELREKLKSEFIPTVPGVSQNNIMKDYSISRYDLNKENSEMKEKIERFIESHDIIENFSGLREGNIVKETKSGELKAVPVASMGDGFRAIIGLIRQIIRSDSDTVLIEEPENHLHPGYISELVDFIVDEMAESEIQLFITTHSADFIEEFFEPRFTDSEWLKEEFSLFRLQRRGIVEPMGYEESREELEELKMDLRGT